MKISIIVPVYNSEKYITDCLTSLINQTYKNIEIIIVDDGSNDKSFKICSKYSKKDSRIKIYKKLNGGVSSARNFGIEQSTGSFIMFVDSDDYLNINSIENAVKYIDADDKICIFDCENIDGNFINRSLKKQNEKIEYISSVLLWNNKTSFNSKYINSVVSHFYNTEYIKNNNIRFVDGLIIGEDMIFNIESIKNIDSIKYSNVNVYNYRSNHNSVMHKSNSEVLNNDIKFIEYLLTIFKNSNYSDLYNIAKNRLPLGGILTCCKHYIFIDKELSYKKRICILKNMLENSLYSNAINNMDAVRKYLNIKQYILLHMIKKRLYTFVYFIMRLV